MWINGSYFPNNYTMQKLWKSLKLCLSLFLDNSFVEGRGRQDSWGRCWWKWAACIIAASDDWATSHRSRLLFMQFSVLSAIAASTCGSADFMNIMSNESSIQQRNEIPGILHSSTQEHPLLSSIWSGLQRAGTNSCSYTPGWGNHCQATSTLPRVRQLRVPLDLLKEVERRGEQSPEHFIEWEREVVWAKGDCKLYLIL